MSTRTFHLKVNNEIRNIFDAHPDDVRLIDMGPVPGRLTFGDRIEVRIERRPYAISEWIDAVVLNDADIAHVRFSSIDSDENKHFLFWQDSGKTWRRKP